MTERKNNNLLAILSVMFGFFIMGFVDIIGMTINYVKIDFVNLSDTMVNLFAVSCYIWFLIFSIPTGMLMNRIGRRKTVALSFIIHILAFGFVLIDYSYTTIMVAFSLVGIGNTILQVSLNPLVTNVISKDKLTGTLTLGQFIKAICSFTGPILVAWFTGTVFGWKLIFPVYAVISLIGLIWLLCTPIKEEIGKATVISFGDTFGLFKDKYILAFFIGILVLVGVDVGMNITFPKYLQESYSLDMEKAGLGNSVYFFARTLGAFIGGIVLMKFSEYKFYRISIILGLIGLAVMVVSNGLTQSMIGVVLFGLGYSNLFAIIFSLALKRMPTKANEISALLIMGVSGGGILPPIMGLITDKANTQVVGIVVLAVVWLYLFFLLGKVKKQSVSEVNNN